MVCKECGLDLNWFDIVYSSEYLIEKKDEMGCSGDRKVTECPNYKSYERDISIGSLLNNNDNDNDNKEKIYNK